MRGHDRSDYRLGMKSAEGTSREEVSVKTHVKHILAKLDARDRVQAVVFAYEAGLAAPGG